MSGKAIERPKVFVSYSWTTPEHVQDIISLAKRLTEDDGVHVILDQWDLLHGHDRIAFMEKAVTDKSVQKVLIISDAAYAEKANAKKGGVGTESQIISPELYGKIDQNKFIPIAWEKTEAGEFCLPAFVKHLYPLDFTTTQKRFENHEQLVRVIYEKPLHLRPAIGNPPAYVTDSRSRFAPPSGKFESFKNAAIQERSVAVGLAREYLSAFHFGLEQFRITPAVGSGLEFDDLIVQSFEEFLPWRNQLVEFCFLLFETSKPTDSMKIITGFLERLIVYKHPPERMTSYNDGWFDNFKLIVYECFIYVVSTLFVRSHFKEMAYVLAHSYLAPKALRGFGGDPIGTFEQFYGNPQSLDTRNQRLGLRRISLMADLIYKRATTHEISATNIMEVDLILYLKGMLHQSRWYPITSVYLENRPYLEFFVRCQTEDGLQNLCTILQVKDLVELNQIWTVYSEQNSRKWYQLNFQSGYGINLLEVFKMDKWGTKASPRLT